MEKDILSSLSYCPGSGVFRWTNLTGKACRFNGQIAGSISSKGYRRIKVAGKVYRAHRLAWLSVYGKWPSQQVDHINGIRDDNRICNLRDVAPRTNSQNRRGAASTNSTGLLGVTRRRGRDGFIAQIRINGRQTFLGRYDTAEEAHSAYLVAKARFHGEAVCQGWAGANQVSQASQCCAVNVFHGSNFFPSH